MLIEILYHAEVFGMDIFLQESARRSGDDDALAKVGVLLDWSAFWAILKL